MRDSAGALQTPSAVRLLWVDGAGIRRVRAVPYSLYSRTCENGLGLTEATMGARSYTDTVAPGSGVSAVGEIRLMPQPKTFVQLPHYTAHGLTIAELHKTPGEAWDCCPRAALRRVLQQAKDMFGMEIKVGFESEFVLMQPKGGSYGAPTNVALALAGHQDVVPFDSAAYCNSTSFQAAAPVLDDMVASLESCGIQVQQFHAESAPGQFEISTAPYDALSAVDKLLVTREVITGVAQKHRVLASFLPKIKPNAAGNGAHIHISIWKDGKNLLESLTPNDWQSKSPGSSFVGGVLQHLPSLLPFTAPSHFSYLRLAPNCWSGAFNVWGWDNREAPIRLTVPPSGRHNTNFEFKSSDATCNPYVALSAIVTAGLLGVLRQLSLPSPVAMNPADMNPEDLTTQGFMRLPSALDEALQALKNDPELMDALSASIGPALLNCLIAVRDAEVDYKPSTSEALFRW